ncbi:MAG: hypothetical protein H7A54_10645 [Akkermansiaceae bacterium]|nr:hypothetical protein [Akkermansiaceae bacterium]
MSRSRPMAALDRPAIGNPPAHGEGRDLGPLRHRPTTLDLTVTATLAPIEADAYDYDDTNDRRTSRPFRLRIERDLIPE